MAAERLLVHGPTAWGCAVRDGTASSASLPDANRTCAAMRKRMPVLRGPRSAGERSRCCDGSARAPRGPLPVRAASVLGAMLGTAVAAKVLRRSRLSPGTREIAAAGVAFSAALALRGPNLAATTVPSTSRSAVRERRNACTQGAPRCGSQLIAPMVASSLAVNVVAAKAPAGTRNIARLVGTAGAIGGSVEVFSWVARNPSHPLARVLARPGFELQRHLSTAEPSAEQLEVANAARDACLALEQPAPPERPEPPPRTT